MKRKVRSELDSQMILGIVEKTALASARVRGPVALTFLFSKASINRLAKYLLRINYWAIMRFVDRVLVGTERWIGRLTSR